MGSFFIYSLFSAQPFDQKLEFILIYILIFTRPFDQIIGSSFIYYFFSARPSDQKLGSSLIYILHLHTTIRQKYVTFFLSFILSLCTNIRPKFSVLINLFFHLYMTIRPKLRATLILKCIIFLIVPIFCLQYYLYIPSATIILLYFVHYTHRSAALVLRTLYPWLYEVLAVIFIDV